ncbi:MAG: hypothetical protein CND86_00060 [Bacteroidetes bacterium MED-G21]|nr:MAG: hypothetical protein CND86_00060 [Bacteroidetes bacterium MED-G21]
MKAVFTAIFILCFAITSAQNFDAGLLGGFSTSQVTGDNLSGFNKLGSRFGAYISYPINKKMNYQLEMQYLEKGSKKPFTENSPETYLFELNYIELPTTLNYQVKKGISIESGIGTAFLVDYKEQDEIADINTDKPNTFAIDFLLGVQYQFKKNLKLNIRYANSISRIRKHASEEELGLNSGQFSSLVTFAFMYQISR